VKLSADRRLYLANVSTAYVQIAARTAVMFLLTPFLIARLGQASFGLWIMLMTIVAYFEFCDLGFTTTLARDLPVRRARGDRAGISEAISSIFFGFVMMLVVLIPVALLGTVLLDNLFRIPLGEAETARTTLMIVFAVFIVGFERRVFETVINSTERIYVTNVLSIVYNAVYGLTFYLIAASGGGLVDLAWGLLALTTAYVIASFVLARRVLEFHLSWRLFRRDLLRQFWSPSIYYFIAGLGWIVIFHSDNLILSGFIGTAAVAVYAVAFRFVDVVRLLIGKLTDVIAPRISYLHAQGDLVRLRRMALRFVGLSGVVTLGAGAALLLFGYSVLVWWIGVENAVGRGVYNLFVLYLCLHCLTHASGKFIGAMGTHKPVAQLMLVEAVINVALSMTLVGPLGMAGVALATLIAHAVTTGWFVHVHLWRTLHPGVTPATQSVAVSSPLSGQPVPAGRVLS
jgi:O-antigen/teichoic acid export membrane protein